MIRFDVIKEFVVNTLGCKCPEEVFETITLEDDIRTIADVPVSCRIVVGNRLLIYLVTVGDSTKPGEQLRALIEAARKERDGSGYNRARIVLITDDVDTIGPDLRLLFAELRGDDEKIHLHLVPARAIPEFRS